MKKEIRNAAFKRKVALEAIRERKTIGEIAASYEVHPIQVGKWKKQLLEGIEGIFESPYLWEYHFLQMSCAWRGQQEGACYLEIKRESSRQITCDYIPLWKRQRC